MKINTEELKRQITAAGLTIGEISELLGIDHSTFYRKMKCGGETFTVGQMHKIVEVLHLSNDEAKFIFCL
jgi:predicted transcriptional regulator